MSDKNKTRDIGLSDSEKTQKDFRLKGKNYLLAIGIDQYKDFLPLNNAVKDVRDISQLLVERFEFEAINITLLTDEKATRRNIIRALKGLCTKATADDKILIYYSGHGYLDDITDRGFWIPIDAEKEDESSYVSNANLRDYIKAMKSRHTLLISDSCFSGALMARDATREVSGAFDTWEQNKSRYVFSSGKGIVSDGKANENSPFARAIIKQLSSLSDSRINIVRLADDVTRHVRFNYEQQAEISPLFDTGHDGGQFVFHLKKDESADWNEAQTIGTFSAYQTFLAKYPDGENVAAVRAKIKSIKAAELWQKIEKAPYNNINQIAARLRLVDSYVDDYESEQHYIEAVNIARFLKYKKEYLFAKNDEYELRSFLTKRIPNLQEAKAVNKQAQAALVAIKNKENAKARERAEAERKHQEKERIVAKNRRQKDEHKPQPILSFLQDLQHKIKIIPLLLLIPLAIWFFSDGKENVPVVEKTEVLSDVATDDESLKNGEAEEARQNKLKKERKKNKKDAIEADKDAWQKTQKSNTISAYKSYINAYPNGEYYKDAKNNIVLLEMAARKASVPSSDAVTASSGKFKDIRDGNIYTYVTLKDGKKWMSQNLNFKTDASYCYDDKESNCTKYGRLYTWEAAKKACPSGWLLPSDDDWWDMAFQYGKAYNSSKGKPENNNNDAGESAYKALMLNGSTGFSAQLSGGRSDGKYHSLGEYGYYLSSIKVTPGVPLFYGFGHNRGYLYRYDSNYYNSGYSCRCIKD